MEKIIWNNIESCEEGTPIPANIWNKIIDICKAGYISNDTQINAIFFNKIHPEILFPKWDWDTDKIGLEVKRILEE